MKIGRLIRAAFEYMILAGLVWIVLDEHGVKLDIPARARALWKKAWERVAVWHTLNMIRDLPEK